VSVQNCYVPVGGFIWRAKQIVDQRMRAGPVGSSGHRHMVGKGTDLA
jgi:hypothetical protein